SLLRSTPQIECHNRYMRQRAAVSSCEVIVSRPSPPKRITSRPFFAVAITRCAYPTKPRTHNFTFHSQPCPWRGLPHKPQGMHQSLPYRTPDRPSVVTSTSCTPHLGGPTRPRR